MQTIVLILTQVYLRQSLHICFKEYSLYNTLLQAYAIICVALATVILQILDHINKTINTLT